MVLSNGMARLLNSCLTLDVVTMCETLNILPANYFGAWPGYTTTDSIHLLTKTVKDLWRKNQVTSALLLDIKSTFPSVDITRLAHNMRKQGIPKEYREWLGRRFKDRQTTLMFNRFYSDPFSIQNGLNQGDPFLGILYLFYNSDLLKIPDIKLNERMLLFIDDAAILVTGKDFSATHDKLHNIMTRTNGIIDWASLYNCKFRVKKFQLLDLTKKKVPQPLNSRRKVDTPCKALKLGNQCIPSMDTTRFLGITLDNKLSWKP